MCSFIYKFFNQRCTNPGCLVARTTKNYVVRCNVCGFSVWKLLHVSLLEQRILRWFLDFLKLVDLRLIASYEVTLKLRVTELKKRFILIMTLGTCMQMRSGQEHYGKSMKASLFFGESCPVHTCVIQQDTQYLMINFIHNIQ